jgi:hypothetical protein
VIARLDCGLMAKLMGSETASAPLGIVKDVFPLNVTVCSVLGWIALTPAAPWSGRATVTAVMGRSFSPKALEMRIRIVLAPMDVWTV